MDASIQAFLQDWRRELTDDIRELRLDIKEIRKDQSEDQSRIQALETSTKNARWYARGAMGLAASGVVEFVINHVWGKHP